MHIELIRVLKEIGNGSRLRNVGPEARLVILDVLFLIDSE